MNSNLHSNVQNYLNQLQSVISRMASNCASVKNFAFVLLGAWISFTGTIYKTLSLSSQVNSYVLIGLLFPIGFGLFDTMYLQLERKFRNKFNNYVKLYREVLISASEGLPTNMVEKLYDFNPESPECYTRDICFCTVLMSWSVLWVYIPQIGIIILCAFIFK